MKAVTTNEKKVKSTTVTMDPVKKILISQPEPTSGKSPYFDIAKKYRLKIDFRQFIELEGVDYKLFRKQKVTLLDYTAIILTSRNAIDHFFRICEELRVRMPDSTKYFCPSEAVALYLQKYTQYRKRKVFYGTGSGKSMKDLLLKYRTGENWLYPGADDRNPALGNFLKDNEFVYREAAIYQIVSSDITDLSDITYDMIIFFSTSGVASLYDNFPDFEQNKTIIAAFGAATSKCITDKGLKIQIKVPSPGVASMSKALELYVKEANKRKR